MPVVTYRRPKQKRNQFSMPIRTWEDFGRRLNDVDRRMARLEGQAKLLTYLIVAIAGAIAPTATSSAARIVKAIVEAVQ